MQRAFADLDRHGDVAAGPVHIAAGPAIQSSTTTF
jgi:hypothetical protein